MITCLALLLHLSVSFFPFTFLRLAHRVRATSATRSNCFVFCVAVTIRYTVCKGAEIDFAKGFAPFSACDLVAGDIKIFALGAEVRARTGSAR